MFVSMYVTSLNAAVVSPALVFGDKAKKKKKKKSNLELRVYTDKNGLIGHTMSKVQLCTSLQVRK